MNLKILALGCILLSAPQAFATPSTTFWAPSTASCQEWAVPHITYDTYFDQGPTAGQAGAPNYPIDTGVTVGYLPFKNLEGEIGYDLLFPQNGPLVLSSKFCTPESSIFSGAPAVSVGIFDLGFSPGVNNFDVLYFVLQKTIPGIGGYVAFGAYHGLGERLFTNSDGVLASTGLLAGIFSPDWMTGLPGLKKINFAADIQSGKNYLGAWGVGPYFYFTDNIDLLTGPVFFLDPKEQPGGRDRLWTVQLDVNVPLR